MRKRTNVAASTEGVVEKGGASTEEGRKDGNDCTEVRNLEEAPALM